MSSESIKKLTQQVFDGFLKASKGLFQLTISGVIEREGGFYDWGYLKLSKRLAQVFAADREVLLLISTFNDQQSRTVKVAKELIDSSDGRLEATLAIIVHQDPGGNLKLQSWGREQGITVLPFSFDVERPPKHENDIEGALCRELFSYDLFDVTGPVSDDRNFYGRRSEAQDLARQLQTGQIRSCLGIRKIGKTSIVNRIIDETKENHGCAFAMVDCSRDEIWSLNGGQLIAAIARALQQCIGQEDRYRVVEPYKDNFEFGKAMGLLTKVINASDTPLIVFFDEIDYITPGSPTAEHWRTQFNPFWRNLRAVYQEAARRRKKFSLFLSGVSSKSVRVGEVGGVENAALALVPEEYLAPLPRGATVAMLKHLSRSTGWLADWR